MKNTISLTLSLAMLTGSMATAEQFTFIDDQITWTKSGYDYPPMLGPKNWTSPVDYVNGKVYARYSVITKPSNKNVGVQLCMWQDGYSKESCSAIKNYTSTGTYYYDWGTPAGWWKLKPLDYTRAFQCAYVMHKDGSVLLMTGACGSHCYTGTDIDRHVPIVFNLKVIVVSKGSTFAPPADWGGCPWSGCKSATGVISETGRQGNVVHYSRGAWNVNRQPTQSGISIFDPRGRAIRAHGRNGMSPGVRLIRLDSTSLALSRAIITN